MGLYEAAREELVLVYGLDRQGANGAEPKGSKRAVDQEQRAQVLGDLERKMAAVGQAMAMVPG